jgi:carbamoyl-phosphate synthase large subunit
MLITGAGSGASENLIRSLLAGEPALHVVGCHDDRFILAKSSAARRYVVPGVGSPRFVEAIEAIVVREHVQLVLPTSDADVLALSAARSRLPCFLPADDVIRLCQDKQALADVLRSRGVPVPETYPVTDLARLEAVFERLRGHSRVWCRARTGTRSLAAAPVTGAEQARAWIRHWEDARGIAPSSFSLAEYLPGRDFLCQTVWRDGRLILASTFERLAYFGGEGNPSGRSSLSSLAKTVVDPRLVHVTREAIEAIAPQASGAFAIDLKENARGVPCVTEINAGRFFIGMTAFTSVLKHNMPLTFVRLALGEPVGIVDEYDAVEDYYLVRDLDTPPGVFHADELLEKTVDLDDA